MTFDSWFEPQCHLLRTLFKRDNNWAYGDCVLASDYDALAAERDEYSRQMMAEERAKNALAAENARLREALRAIVSRTDGDMETILEDICRTAYAALGAAFQPPEVRT